MFFFFLVILGASTAWVVECTLFFVAVDGRTGHVIPRFHARAACHRPRFVCVILRLQMCNFDARDHTAHHTESD